MKSHRLGLLLMSLLLAVGTLASGCGVGGGSSAMPKVAEGDDGKDRAQVAEVSPRGSMPLRTMDLASFEVELFKTLSVPPATQREFRILDTKNVANGTYVLYSLPGNDGLAFAGRRSDGRIAMYKAHWPFAQTDANQDLIVVRAIPPNNEVNPPYGVLAGRVYSPFIEHIEVNYRDGKTDRLDVSHTRGFILVRKAFDPRYVQVRGYGMNGNPYWNIDTR